MSINAITADHVCTPARVPVVAARPQHHHSPANHSAVPLPSTPSSPLAANPLIDGPLLAARWTTIVAAPWRGEEHINAFEVRAVGTAVRWALSTPVAIGRRLLVLSDSQVAVGALTKGRSSSALLLRRVRPVAAALLASGVQLALRWIPSASNPADEPSRRFSRGGDGGDDGNETPCRS